MHMFRLSHMLDLHMVEMKDDVYIDKDRSQLFDKSSVRLSSGRGKATDH